MQAGRRLFPASLVDGDRLAYRDNEDELQAELAALRRQVAVLEHDRRGLMDALIEQIGADSTLALMNDIRLASMKPAEDSDATE